MRSEGDDSAERAGTKVDAHGWVRLALCDGDAAGEAELDGDDVGASAESGEGERSAVAVAGPTLVTIGPGDVDE
jgi:hypothetical protein